MNDQKPDLTTTEVRQANGRRMNLRVLIVGLVVVIIGFVLIVWFNSAVSPETETTTQPGETLEDITPVEPGDNLENLPTPVPEAPAQ